MLCNAIPLLSCYNFINILNITTTKEKMLQTIIRQRQGKKERERKRRGVSESGIERGMSESERT